MDMLPTSPHHRLELPAALGSQLDDFRQHVGRVKLLEAVAAAAAAVVGLWLIAFALERWWDTSTLFRTALLGVVLACAAVVPLAIYRWIWRTRHPTVLTRVLGRRLPHLGDQLLGILELVENRAEQTRSPALCAAAIEQVARAADGRDLRVATPDSRHRLWSTVALLTLAIAAGLLVLYPAAALNTAARLFAPWHDTPRYTFTVLEPLPAVLHVAHGEPFMVRVPLAARGRWQPPAGEAVLGTNRPVRAMLQDGQYAFELPGQIEPDWLQIRIGDTGLRIRVVPTLRPELIALAARVKLPAYLGRPVPVKKDVRGGTVALVQGSRVKFAATASRPLQEASVDGKSQVPSAATISSPEYLLEDSRTLEFRWRDKYHLTGVAPFTLTVTAEPDQPPSLACENLPRRRVVLDSEQLVFQIKAHDDFGVKQIGIEWHGLDQKQAVAKASGERIVAAGGHEKMALDVAGTFSATALGIEPQPIGLRVFVEDYLPGRPRVYSPTTLLQILDAQQHAIWMTEQLSQWHRRALEVRDRELQLYETNRQLRELAPIELEKADVRRRIETQAAAERAGGRRLSHLSRAGVELIRQAARNPEFGVGHLERWAEMLKILREISAQRMPSVADLLKEAAQAPALASKPSASGKKAPHAGQSRATAAGNSAAAKPSPPVIAVPQISDVESSHGLAGPKDQRQPPDSNSSGQPSLSLPVTTLLGGGAENDSCPVKKPPVKAKVEEAVRAQRDLLAEFEKVADALNKLLANLEGSTLVKRLKAASRLQDRIAGRIGTQLDGAFGLPAARVGSSERQVLSELAGLETDGSQNVSRIMDDMQGYFERRRFMQFKTVLDQMRQFDVVAGLRQLGDELPAEQGLSMAQCEYWSDSLDRWAEDLVDPASGGT